MLGIAASVTFEFPELSAALWVASQIVSMLPSASPDLMHPFDGTYNQLQNVFASGISQTQKALDPQSSRRAGPERLVTGCAAAPARNLRDGLHRRTRARATMASRSPSTRP